MSSQQEAKLSTRDANGNTVPYCCKHCGRQRIGVILNIITRTLLPCACGAKDDDHGEAKEAPK